MGKLGDKLGRLDDKSVIYRANDPEQKVAWGRAALAWIGGSVLVGGLTAVGNAAGDEGLALAASSVGIVVFLIGYVIWRRRRNKRLTGSPTDWPS